MSDIRTSRLRKKIQLDGDVLTHARNRTRVAFDRYDKVAVSFSGGKDSTIVLELALEVAEELGRLPLDVVHYDEEAIPYETEEYVRRRADDPRIRMQWICAPVKHGNACSPDEPYWSPWDPNVKEKWVRPLPKHPTVTTSIGNLTSEAIGRLPAEKRPSVPESNYWVFPPEDWGNVAVLLGIRADESITRTQAVLWRKTDNYIITRASYEHGGGQGNVTKVYPIYDMTDVDLWTIVRDQRWDYNQAYDILEMVGVPRSAQRCAPPYGNEPMQSLYTFAVAFPDIWPQMQRRVKGAATAARYSKTELYGFGRLTKPKGITWEEAIRQALQTHNEPLRSQTAQQIKQAIKAHYSKTKDPILETTPHPDTGVSWSALYRIAIRTDPKNRKKFIHYSSNEGMRRKYDAERRALEDAGRLQNTAVLPE